MAETVLQDDLQTTAAKLAATAKEVEQEQAVNATSLFSKALDVFTGAINRMAGGESAEELSKGRKDSKKKKDEEEKERTEEEGEEGEDEGEGEEDERELMGKSLETTEQYADAEPVLLELTKAMTNGFARLHGRIAKLEKSQAASDSMRDVFLKALGESQLGLHKDLDLVKSQPASRARTVVQQGAPVKGGDETLSKLTRTQVLDKINKAIIAGKGEKIPGLYDVATQVELGRQVSPEFLKSLDQ